jgi:hypothetical protein
VARARAKVVIARSRGGGSGTREAAGQGKHEDAVFREWPFTGSGGPTCQHEGMNNLVK